jgi:hypothetical protein
MASGRFLAHPGSKALVRSRTNSGCSSRPGFAGVQAPEGEDVWRNGTIDRAFGLGCRQGRQAPCNHHPGTGSSSGSARPR